MFTGQLELGLKAEKRNVRNSFRRAHQTVAAQWWFERMRQVVDRAIDYPVLNTSTKSLAHVSQAGGLFN